MKLTEILNVISDEKQKGLVNIDDWKWADADHLKTMGFEFDGEYVMSLKTPPISVYKKKLPQGECFVIDEKGRKTQQYADFESVIKYFDTYSQPEIDKERN